MVDVLFLWVTFVLFINNSKDCVSHESLGMKDERIIPNGNFGASSYANSPCLPHFARLDSKGWCAARRQTGESVWVDLNAVKTTTKISMRGRDGNDQRPTQFTLAYRTTSLDQWAGYFGGPQETSSCSGPMV
ncbi:hypothetical protein AC249_AIPGENE12740 [Exaiptasia diaphana]|nr:hypothetical protein AC249_AIPGENE12740 [Exaiptasia diaphana]